MSCGEPVDCNSCQYRNQPARQNTFELSGTSHNSAMAAIADLARKYIDNHTDVPNWVIHDFVAWCRQQHQ